MTERSAGGGGPLGEVVAAWWSWARPTHEETSPGPAGNRRLTATVGVLLTPLLVLVFISGALLDSLWRVHYFVGFMLIPLLALKSASTGWKAFRYYSGRREYRAAGPPTPLLRALGPVIVAAAVLVSVSGVWLWVEHSRSGTWSTVHTDAALVLLAVASIHLLAHLPGATSDATAELTARRTAGSARRDGVSARRGLVTATILIGVAVGIGTIYPSQAPARHLDRQRVAAAGP